MTWLLTLAFDGTEYCFQVQPNGRSVAAAFQDALEAVIGFRPDIKGCSRTDAGVHALGFALSFEADLRIPPEKLPLALNTKLPRDIRVLKARVVPDGFHARYAAHTKTYLYRIHNSAIDSPFEERYYCRIPGRTITACGVERHGDTVEITVTADGYLYNMVRILAGTLCEAGAGRLDPAAVPAILASRDRKNAGPTLPAKGLFLHHVDYGKEAEG